MRKEGRFGPYGGAYVPQILVPALRQLEAVWLDAREDSDFQTELSQLLTHYVGRPTPLYRCQRFGVPAQIYLKREDLLHGGAHKTNQVVAQALLAQRMGKTRIIAETGAGQHGVATAMASALFGMRCVIYMGALDVKRQALNVFRMRLMGAEVVAVESGGGTLKDAVNAALRDWAESYPNTHYLLGTAAGPHPFPSLVADFQKVIGEEARAQILEQAGRLPDVVTACVGGGSNAIGMFRGFVGDEAVELVGAEGAGHGLHTDKHSATLERGELGILHGAQTLVLQDTYGQILETHSVSAGLDYPGIGPEHAYLQSTGRARYEGITDDEAVAAFCELSRTEGILPALESSHALAYALKRAQKDPKAIIIVNLSGRGDKDAPHVQAYLEAKEAKQHG